MKEIAAQLMAIRKGLGITQYELAHNAGYNINTVYRFESGKNTALQTVIDIAQALGYRLILERIK